MVNQETWTRHNKTEALQNRTKLHGVMYVQNRGNTGQGITPG